MKIVPPNDGSFFLRLFHIPYILLMFKLVYSSKNPQFPSPRFQLFTPILSPKKANTKRESLLFLIVKQYKKDIALTLIITFMMTLLNLLVPQIIKQFFSLMKLQTLEQNQIMQATYITEKFILLQIMRAFISGHVGRACYELSLKMESCLSAQITGKALRISSECRTKLPESEIYHLETVDLKMIGKLFQHIWMALEIPLTLLVAVFLLFRESFTFGFIGLYWMIITFFLQRWLSDRIIDCNLKKNILMQQRSEFNYEVIENIRLARLDTSQTILIEKNNDCFLKQNSIHRKMYHYQSLFEISLVLLPIVVALSISLYNHNEAVSITIKEVYMLLTLLGICYRPLKNLQQFLLKIQDGLHSIKRIQIYLDLPQNNKLKNKWIQEDRDYEPQLRIAKDTMTMIRSLKRHGAKAGFYSQKEINLSKGQRLVILGRKGQGTSLFLRSLLGQIYVVNGDIQLQGSVAYLPEVNFFRRLTINQNILFYDNSAPQEEIKQLYKLLELDKDLKFRKGLQQAVEIGKFSEIELKKIGLARVFISKREVIILDCPFRGLGAQIVQKLQKLLRERQEQGAMIIIAQNYLRKTDPEDKIIIISNGQIKQYGKYDQLLNNSDSDIHSFHQTHNLTLSDRISFLTVVRQFQMKIKKILVLGMLSQQHRRQQQESLKLNKLLLNVGKYSLKLKNQRFIRKQTKKEEKKAQNIFSYFQLFINQLPCTEWLFSILIIICSQLLHIFIQYQIGQQYKKGGLASFSSLKKIINYQFALTCGLAILIYFQYYILCLTSTIIGNQIYKKSLESLCRKNIKWFQQNYSPFIADKYNHDYDQIYTIVNHIFSFFKFIVILLTTLFLIDVSFNIIAVITTIISISYYFMLHFFRRGEEVLIKSYGNYKHNFVKIFDEIIEGGFMINVFGKAGEAYGRAKQGFISVSSYRQAINSIKIVQDLLCELISCLIIALGLQYGTILKIKEGEQNEALIAVSVMLLFNLSEVFKSMMQTIIKLQSFFSLKLVSYIEIISEQPVAQRDTSNLLRYNIQFNEVILNQKNDPIFEIYPLTLSIAEGQKIILYEQDNTVRNNMLLALSNNIENFVFGKFNNDVIKIGSLTLSNLSKQTIKKYFTVIMPDNFYFSGTLEENFRWKNQLYQEKTAIALSNTLHIQKEIPEYQIEGLKTSVKYSHQNHRQLSRKIALIRAILKKSKVIIIKDTPWIVGGMKITELIKQWKLDCTIIGITNDLMGIEGAARLVYLEKLKIIEDGLIQNLVNSQMSLGGVLLRDSSFETYSFLKGEEEKNLDQILAADTNSRNLIKSKSTLAKTNTMDST